MRFRVLGPVEATTGSESPAWLGAPKQRTLLAVLALHANRLVGGDQLTAALWQGRPPRSAAGLLRTYASELRQSLGLTGAGTGPALVARAGGYRLEVARPDLDMLVFTDLLAHGRRALAGGEFTKAAGLLHDALGIWRGRAAEDAALDADSEHLVAGLEEQRIAAEEAWADAHLALGQYTDIVTRLKPLTGQQPLRERPWAQLMLALYLAGRQAEALAAFRELRQRTTAELGIEPGPALRELHQQILAGDAAPGASARPACSRPALRAATLRVPVAPAHHAGTHGGLAR